MDCKLKPCIYVRQMQGANWQGVGLLLFVSLPAHLNFNLAAVIMIFKNTTKIPLPDFQYRVHPSLYLIFPLWPLVTPPPLCYLLTTSILLRLEVLSKNKHTAGICIIRLYFSASESLISSKNPFSIAIKAWTRSTTFVHQTPKTRRYDKNL